MLLLLRPHHFSTGPRNGRIVVATLFVPDIGDTGARSARLTWFETRIGQPGVLFPPEYEGPVDMGHREDVHTW